MARGTWRPATVLALVVGIGWAHAAGAHFLELLPSTDIVPEQGERQVTLTAAFTHPMERGPVLELGRPLRFGVVTGGRTSDLGAALTPKPMDGHQTWEAAYKIGAPGDYLFFLEPAPYWEAAEKKWLIHDAKVVVDFGAGSGWERPVGLPMEILPLSRPYGLWTGNLFRAVALKDGLPLPGAMVEVEWANDGSVMPPADPFITQVVRTDAGGIFAYALPRAGWWGFTVLAEGPAAAAPDGSPARTELGGTIWVKAVDMK
ncbi:MAG: DUF4198 domain-containing protein [Rhodospirillaceae bacterium]